MDRPNRDFTVNLSVLWRDKCSYQWGREKGNIRGAAIEYEWENMLAQMVSKGGTTIWISLSSFSCMTLKHIICLISDQGRWHFADFWNIYHVRGSLWSIQCSASHISTCMLHMWQNLYGFTCRQERSARGTHSFTWSSSELKNWRSSGRNGAMAHCSPTRLQITFLGCTSFHFPFRKHWNCCQLLT